MYVCVYNIHFFEKLLVSKYIDYIKRKTKPTAKLRIELLVKSIHVLFCF